MPQLKVKVTFADSDDWLALYWKHAPDDAVSCGLAQMAEDGWNPIQIIGARGSVELAPGRYYYRYEAGNTAGNKTQIEFLEDGDSILDTKISIGSGFKTVGCNVFLIS